MGFGLWDFGWFLGLDSDFGGGERGQAPRVKNPFLLPGSVRAKPEGLAYLDATAKGKGGGRGKGNGGGRGKVKAKAEAEVSARENARAKAKGKGT